MFSNSAGDMAELLLKRILRFAGYDPQAYRDFSSTQAVEEAFEVFNPRYLASAKAFTNGSLKDLLDKVGADFVIPDQGKWLGIDATINEDPAELKRKRSKARGNREPWEYLGLAGLGVVRIEFEGSSYDLPDFGELPEVYQDALLSKVYDFVDHLKDGNWGSLLVLEYPTYSDL